MKHLFFASKKLCATSKALEQQDLHKENIENITVLERQYLKQNPLHTAIPQNDLQPRTRWVSLYSGPWITEQEPSQDDPEKNTTHLVQKQAQTILKKTRDVFLTKTNELKNLSIPIVQATPSLTKPAVSIKVNKQTKTAMQSIDTQWPQHSDIDTYKSSYPYRKKLISINAHNRLNNIANPDLRAQAEKETPTSMWEMRQHLGCVRNYVMLLSSILAIVIFGLSNMLYAADGRIYFTGEIVDATCLVQNEVRVMMANTAADYFRKIGDAGQTTPFNIELSQCPDAVHSATISFKATANQQNPELIATTGSAEGVAIELIDNSNEQRLALKNGESAPSASTRLKTGNAVNLLTFGARYVSTASTVKSGSAAAYADFTVTYQ